MKVSKALLLPLLVAVFLLPRAEAHTYNGGWTPGGEVPNSVALAAFLDGVTGDRDFTNSWANGWTQLSSAMAVYALKGITDRDRPDGYTTGRWNSSYPSGHSAVAFGYAGALGTVNRGLRVPLLAVGVLVSRHRILDDRHRPGECAVGGYIGYTLGLRWGHRALKRRSRLREARRRRRGLARHLLPGVAQFVACRATEGRIPMPGVQFRF